MYEEVIGGPLALTCPKCGKKYHGNFRTGENINECPYCGHKIFDPTKILKNIRR